MKVREAIDRIDSLKHNTYTIGEKIDLPLPEFSGDGPSGPQAATEAPISPASGK